RAAIATDVGGVVDLLGPAAAPAGGDGYSVRERGVLVPPGDAAGFVRGLARLAADEGLRRGLGERGRRFIHDHYSKDRLLNDVRRLYTEAVRPTAAGRQRTGPA